MRKLVLIVFWIVSSAAVANAAVVQDGKNYVGLSSDSTPTTATNGSRFFETDTRKVFLINTGVRNEILYEPANANIQTHVTSTWLDKHGGTAQGALTMANVTNALNSGNFPLYSMSGVANGATAKGFVFDTTNVLNNSTAQIFSIRSAGVDVAYFKKNSVGTASLNFGGTAGQPTNFFAPTRYQFQSSGQSTIFGIYPGASAFTTSVFGALSGAQIQFISANGGANTVGYRLNMEGVGGVNCFAPNDAMLASGEGVDLGDSGAISTTLAYWRDAYFTGTVNAGVFSQGGVGVVVLSDPRLSDARTPTAHASTHVTGGSDVIANVVAGGNSGLMTGADKTKLNGISGTNTGDQIVPVNEAGAANNFLTAYNSTTGAWTKAQPAFSNLSGSASASQLPLPTASTIGGVMSKTCTGTDKLSAIGTDGIPVCAADQTGSGSFSVTQVELNIGTTPVYDKEFTVTDAGVASTSKILCSPAYVDIAGDNDADEISMSRIYCVAGKPAAGSFVLTLIANDGPINGKIRANYSYSN